MRYEDIKSLSEIRFEHAEECIAAAKNLAKSQNYKSAANRSYYAVFHAMRAVLAFDGIDMKHHSGIIAEFRRAYIKTGIFPKEMSDVISSLFDVRTECDYDDYFVISKEETETQIKYAEAFIKNVRAYLDKK